MTTTLTRNLTEKWVLVLEEYEQIRTKKSTKFTTVQQLCEVFKVHRKDIRRYYERWIAAGKTRESLLPHKRGRKTGHCKILSKDEERTIMKIRRKFNSSEFEIQHMVKGYFKIHPSVSTIYRTFQRYALNPKRKEAIKRYEKMYPGELVHTDTYKIDPTMFVDRGKHSIVGFIDDCTRLCYAEIIERATAAEVSKVFSRSYKWFSAHGFLPEKIMSDNGSEFSARSETGKNKHVFESMLSIFQVHHVYTRPYHPQTNGKIERFWRILQDECLVMQKKTLTKKGLEQELENFLYRYNYLRRHGALDYTTPLDKLKKIADLLPKY